jgi:hypothetical protein
MSFPPATEMFQFAGFASWTYGFSPGSSFREGVAPFGDPGITDRSHLPRAFRSVLRPSSPLSAKASTRCPCHARFTRAQRQTPLSRKQRSDIRNQILLPSSRPCLRKTCCGTATLQRASMKTPLWGTDPAPSGAGAMPRGHNSLSSPFNHPRRRGCPAGEWLSSPERISLPSVLKVEVIGFEPTPSCLQSRRSPS